MVGTPSCSGRLTSCTASQGYSGNAFPVPRRSRSTSHFVGSRSTTASGTRAAQVQRAASPCTTAVHASTTGRAALPPPIMARAAAAFLLQPHIGERHAAVDRLEHVVHGQQSRRGRGQRFHLDSRWAAAFHAREDAQPAPFDSEIDRYPAERQGMCERDEVRGAFRRLDGGQPRHAEHISLLCRAACHETQRRRPHANAPGGHRRAVRGRLFAHVDHVRGAAPVEMGQFSASFSARSALNGTRHGGRYHSRMRFAVPVLLVALLAGLPRAFAQALPDLGSAGDVVLSPQMERRIGEQVVRDIRFRDPAYLDDPEVADYLNTLGAQIVRANPAARQDFEFFAMHDNVVNAFALPGGFIGVNTGLINLADTESELASVLAHEVAHVSQRHIARGLGQDQQMQMPVLAALAAALLLGRAHPDLASGAMVAAQAGAVQTSLAYSRDFEREADRVGLQTLEAAGFDPRAMAVFFEKLQRSMRVSDDSSVPGWLRTHPMTVERIADAQNRAANMPYRQHVDSLDFHLVRARLRAESGEAASAVAYFRTAVGEKRYGAEAAARYGLVAALLRAGNSKEAVAEMAHLRQLGA